MDGLKKVTSVSLSQEDWALLQEMVSRSGWKRGKLMALGLRYLYQEQFKDKTVNAEALSRFWEAR